MKDRRKKVIRSIAITALLLLAVLLTDSAQAQESYVTNLRITVRRGPGIDYKIMDFLKSGDEVETLKEDTGWIQVRYGDGNLGWVLKRFLTQEASASHQAEKLLAENSQLKSSVGELENQNETLRRSNQLATEEKEEQTSTTMGPSPLELVKALDLANKLLGSEEEKFRLLKTELWASREQRDWFLIGAATAGLGMILGWLARRLRRKTNWI